MIWLSACAMAASPLAAGVVMSLRTTDYAGPEPRVEASRMTIGARALRMDIESDSALQHTLVFRGGEKPSITVFNHREKSYVVLDQASIDALGLEMRMAMQAATARLGELPPEQQKIVRTMLEGRFGSSREAAEAAPSTLVRTSDRAVKSGLPCVKHQVFRRGLKLREVWTAAPGEIPGGEASFAVLREMADFYSSMISSFEKVGSGFRLGKHPFEDLGRMDGFPVLTHNYAGGRVESEIALLSIEERPLDPTELEPPPDYRPAALGLR